MLNAIVIIFQIENCEVNCPPPPPPPSINPPDYSKLAPKKQVA